MFSFTRSRAPRPRAPKAEDSFFFSWEEHRGSCPIQQRTDSPTGPPLRHIPLCAAHPTQEGCKKALHSKAKYRLLYQVHSASYDTPAFPLPMPPVAPARARSPTPNSPDSDSPRPLADPSKVRIRRSDRRICRTRTQQLPTPFQASQRYTRPPDPRASRSRRPRQIPRSSLEPVGLEDQQIPCSADRVSSSEVMTSARQIVDTGGAHSTEQAAAAMRSPMRWTKPLSRRPQWLGLVQIRSRRTRLTPGCGGGSVPDARSPGRLQSGRSGIEVL